MGGRAGADRRRTVVVDLDRAELRRSAAGGDLDVGRDTDPELDPVAALASPSLLLAERVVADRLGGHFERGGVGAAVVARARERRERERVVVDEVAAPQLDRVDAQLERGLVDESLQQGGRLGTAGPAVRPGRRGVRRGDRDVELDRVEAVRAARHAFREQRKVRADGRIRPGVADEVHAERQEPPLARRRQLGVLHLGPAVRHRHQILAAARDPGDRPAEVSRRRAHRRVLGADACLPAEPATDLRRDHSQAADRDPERVGELAGEPVRHLRRRVEREPTVGLGDGDAPVRLDRHHGHALVDVSAADHDDVVTGRRELEPCHGPHWPSPRSSRVRGTAATRRPGRRAGR